VQGSSPSSQWDSLSDLTGDQAPVERLIYLSRRLVLFPSTHNSWAAALLQHTFTVANDLPPSDCILPQSLFFWARRLFECLFLCCYILTIAVLSLLNRTRTSLAYTIVDWQPRLSCDLPLLITTPRTSPRQLHTVTSTTSWTSFRLDTSLLALSIGTLYETQVLEPCRTHTTTTCTTMCGATHTRALPAVRVRQSTCWKAQVACS
jgi:hypothetical protein